MGETHKVFLDSGYRGSFKSPNPSKAEEKPSAIHVDTNIEKNEQEE